MAQCEWNPVFEKPSQNPPRETDCPNEAEISLGGDGDWHVCESCAALPKFSRIRCRRPLRQEKS